MLDSLRLRDTDEFLKFAPKEGTRADDALEDRVGAKTFSEALVGETPRPRRGAPRSSQYSTQDSAVLKLGAGQTMYPTEGPKNAKAVKAGKCPKAVKAVLLEEAAKAEKLQSRPR